MNQPHSIFLVTSGAYSDFTILAAFSTPEKAQELAHVIEADADVREIELDPDTVSWWITTITMARDGTLLTSQGPYKQQNGPSIFSPRFDFHIKDGAFITFLSYESPTTDPTAALKGANEIRTRLIELNIWPLKIPDNQALLKANMSLGQWRIDTRQDPRKES